MPGRQEAGRLGQVCTVILAEKPQSLETAQFECVQTVELAGGQSNGQGLLLPAIHPNGFRFGTNGGTGTYKEATPPSRHAVPLRAPAHEAVSSRTGLTLSPSWEPSPPGASLVVLADRATRVP
jgi:hypothetical protein